MTLAAIAIVFGGIGHGPANAENPDISSRRASERTDFTDDTKPAMLKVGEKTLSVPRMEGKCQVLDLPG